MSEPRPNAPPTAEFLASVVEYSDDAIITKDLNGRVTSWNNAAERIFGYTAEEMIGNFITRLTARDGRVIPIDDSAAPFRNPDGTIEGVVLVFRNVREHDDAEQQITALKDQLLLITDNMAAAVTRCSLDFRYIWVSSAYASWLRRSKPEIEGHYIRDIIGEQGYQEIHRYMERVLTGERVEYTTKVNFLGPGSRWISAVYVPTWAQGRVDGWIAVVTDITETLRHEEELREINKELARANADLNQFAFAASHDLQEPLRMITNYSQLLVKGYRGQLEGEAALCVGYITDGTRRMRELLGDLLAYTQVTSGGQESAENVDLNVVLQHTLENCKAAIEENHSSIGNDLLPVVRGHHSHFLQLFQNLIGNALKYRSERAPHIHVSAVKESGMWRLAVADNGIGIDPQYHQSVFGVFKRLHGRLIPGMGMGLAICQRVVERGGGRIWVESQEGKGATFYFTLPAANLTTAHSA